MRVSTFTYIVKCLLLLIVIGIAATGLGAYFSYMGKGAHASLPIFHQIIVIVVWPVVTVALTGILTQSIIRW
jgi:hypothetical protein